MADAAVENWKSFASDPDAEYDHVVKSNAADIEPTVTWGISPDQGISIDETIPDPAQAETEVEAKSFQEALGISDQEAADLNVKAAIKSAAADGEITKDEAKSIETAAKAAKMSEADTAEAVSKELDKKDED